MERVRPLIAARMGAAAASRLTFHADERPGSARGGFTVRDGAASLRIASHADLGPWLFGTPEDLVPPVTGDHDLAAVLGNALPLPTLWYGVNYV
jgi:hypothetical protein